MTRARIQLLALTLYLLFGLLAMLMPGIVLDILGINAADRSPVSFLLMRMFGAACVGLALALFFVIRDHLAGKRLMRALGGLEVAVIAAVVISLGADDLGTRAGVIVAILSGAIGLVNFYGAFLAPAEPRVREEVPQPS